MKQLHTVVETKPFLSDCSEEGVPDADRFAIVDAVSRDPTAGVLIQGTGGVFKRRFAGRGKGKSGGWRVMVAYVGPNLPAYLLALLGKGSRENFTPAERNGMAALVKQLKAQAKTKAPRKT